MPTKKEIIIFLAGAEAFHTLAHAVLALSGLLPLHIFFITLTPKLNLALITTNSIITLALLYWASRTYEKPYEFFCATQEIAALESKKRNK